MQTVLELDIPFKKYQMGRIDELVEQVIRENEEVKGVVKITSPENVIITMIEYEELLVQDFKDVYIRYEKNLEKEIHDEIKKILPNNEIIIPYNMQKLVIGDWQQLVVFAKDDIPSIKLNLEFYHSDEILGLESVRTELEFQTIDITPKVEKTLGNTDGEMVTIITPDSTVGLYIINPEYYGHLNEFLIELASSHEEYRHRHQSEQEQVAHVHIRAAFLGQTVTVRTRQGILDLPTDSRLFITELTSHPMRRDIYFELWNAKKE